MERDIKQDMARRNVESVNNRKFRQTKQYFKRMQNKNKTLEEISEVKRKLGQER